MNRIADFRRKFAGCALINSRVNMQYLTGYTGEGAILLLPQSTVILTDFRYIEQAERQSPFAVVSRTTPEARTNAQIKKLMDEAGEKTLYVETDELTAKQYKTLEADLPGISLEELPDVIMELRTVKSLDEWNLIAKAAEISCAAFMDLMGVLHAGMTEKQARAELEYFMLKRGSEGPAFDTIVASGVNGSLPHAVPSDKVIEKGELVTFDFGASFGGYCSDMTRTVAIGEISSELHAIYDAVLEAQLAALKAIKPGVVCKDVDKIARDYLDARYPGAFGHSLGHGVGLQIHERPNLSYRCDKVLEPGHVVTDEPGVYIPGVGGCRIEDTVFVTEGGHINPYTAPKQLITLN